MRKRILYGIMFLASLIFIGCGRNDSQMEKKTVATAVLKLISSGTATIIYGIDSTIALPAGVSVQTMVNSSQTATGVIVASGMTGNSTLAVGTYSAATGTSPARVKVLVADPSGFGLGEFATLNCIIEAGYSPMSSDFTLADAFVSDATGSLMNGVTITISSVVF